MGPQQETMVSISTVPLTQRDCAGDSSKGETYILRRQEVQEAHRAQGYPVQDWQGKSAREKLSAVLVTQTPVKYCTDASLIPSPDSTSSRPSVISSSLGR